MSPFTTLQVVSLPKLMYLSMLAWKTRDGRLPSIVDAGWKNLGVVG